jgi:hypothetical protein
MVKLGPSRAERGTGGEAISAETLRRPPRHPMTQAASSPGLLARADEAIDQLACRPFMAPS